MKRGQGKMKTTTIGLTLVLSGLLLSVGALNVQAAAVGENASTTGRVDFEVAGPGSIGNVIKPDTEEEQIVVPGGDFTTGPLRLTHVPAFDFTTMEIASETIFGKAAFEKYTSKTVTEAADIAHFAQVEDVRGGTTDGWTLHVSATPFKTSPADGDLVLDKSAIVLTEGQIFNTRHTGAELTSRVDGFSADTLITNDNQDVQILKTISGQSTNSTKTSLVFNNAYSQADLVGGATDGYNSGVQLKAVGSDEKAKDKEYTATLTWTLAAAL